LHHSGSTVNCVLILVLLKQKSSEQIYAVIMC